MTKVSINGIEFNGADGEASDFGMFNAGSAEATDTAPWGMVQEMRTFIRIQDERKLRNLVDVGALFGVFSLVFTRYKDAWALAIEPSPWAYEGLVQNVMVNPDRKMFPLQAFIGEESHRTVVCSRQWKHLVANRFPDEAIQHVQEAFTLNEIAGAQSCDCIKIDVEGYEGPVLRGAQRLIMRQRPVIFLEAHFSVIKEVSGDTRESLMNIFRDYDYRVETYRGDKVWQFPDALPSRFVCFPE